MRKYPNSTRQQRLEKYYMMYKLETLSLGCRSFKTFPRQMFHGFLTLWWCKVYQNLDQKPTRAGGE